MYGPPLDRAQIVMTILPIWFPVSMYRCAATTSSSLNVRSTLGLKMPLSMPSLMN